MSGVQMMLVLGAITLLSLLVLNLNGSLLSSDDQMAQAEYTMAATSVGQMMLAKIASKEFDAATVTDQFADPSTFTSPSGLGHAPGEIYPNFNDVDDFHRFTTAVSTPRAGVFNVACLVDYVQPDNPDVPASVQTRTKRVRVAISSPFLAQPVRLVYYRTH